MSQNNLIQCLVYGFVFMFILKIVVKRLIKFWKLPRGPWGLPIVGYLPFIMQESYLKFTEFSKKYGSVFSLRIGSFDVVVVNGWPAIKEALSNDHLLSRPHKDFFTVINEPSIAEMSGHDWKDQMKVTLHTLRNVGLGKSKMEESIKEEVDCFINKLKSESTKPIELNELLSLSLPNNISILLFGHKFDYNDPKKMELDNNLNKFATDFGMINVPMFMPWIAKLFLILNLPSLKEFAKAQGGIEKIILQEIDLHRTKSEEAKINSYIDGFLHEMQKRGSTKSNFTLTTLKRNTTTFYGSGADTSRCTLNWMFQFLVAYPDIQNKIRKEINKILESDTPLEYGHRELMPYTMGFIYESLRYSSIAPINVPRWTSSDTVIDGKLIPKDTLVLFNLWSVHYDPKLYPNPKKFDPTRFLNEDHSRAIKPPHLIAFSGGKRRCPGMSLAYLQLFLYLTNIIRKFQVKPESDTEVRFEGDFGFLRKLRYPVNLIFTEIDNLPEATKKTAQSIV